MGAFGEKMFKYDEKGVATVRAYVIFLAPFS